MIRSFVYLLILLIYSIYICPSRADDLDQYREKLDREFQAQLHQIADQCISSKLNEQAGLTLSWPISKNPHYNYAVLVPAADPLKPQEDAPQLVKYWYARIKQVRNVYADKLFQLSEDQLKSGAAALAYRTVHEVLRENPDHGEARRILGYSYVSGSWRRPGVKTRSSQARVAHPKFRWPANSYWNIDTPHFTISTNVSEAEGLRLGEKLEELYSVWQQIYFDFWSSETQLAAYFRGSSPSLRRKRFQVAYFRSQQGYVDYLKPKIPQAEITLGVYLNHERKSFLFHAERDDLESIWMHEVGHQLFQEYRTAPASIGKEANFWAIEAAALYLESMRKHPGYYTVGGFDASRLQFARNRLFIGRFYIPLNQLTAMNQKMLQENPQIGSIYSQAAGLAHFFMDAQQGEFRSIFIDYLKAIYSDKDNRRTLENLTKQDLAQLDVWYPEFLQVNDALLKPLAVDLGINNLALGRTQITNDALPLIAKQSKLVWLDLTNCAIDDQGMLALKGHPRLNDLGLAVTQVTDQTMPILAGLKNLEELDLSGTKITDQGLAELAKSNSIKVLHLSLNAITDQGLSHLKKMRQLRRVFLQRTKTTAEGIKQLQTALPQLEIVLD